MIWHLDFAISLFYLKECRYAIDSLDNIKAREWYVILDLFNINNYIG